MNFKFSTLNSCAENLKHLSEQLETQVDELSSIIEKMSFLKSEEFEEEEAYLKKKKTELEEQSVKMRDLYKTLEKVSFVFEKAEKRNLSLRSNVSDYISFFDIDIPQWINTMFY